MFIVDVNDCSLSKPIELIAPSSSLDTTDLHLATFLYDEQTKAKVLLTSEQYLIAGQQAEFTPRKLMTYVVDKDKTPVSQPIEISATGIQMRHLPEDVISNKLRFFENKRQDFSARLPSSEEKNELLEDIFHEYQLMNGYIQNRLDKLKTEEQVIEQIVPILSQTNPHIFSFHDFSLFTRHST